MVAKTPPKQRKMVAPLNPTLLRDTVDKVDKCMERLQELQYTVSGGKKVISGVSLSPRSTRGYLRTSLRCKQESLRIKNANSRKSSPPGKLPTNTDRFMYIIRSDAGQPLREELAKSPEKILACAFPEFVPKSDTSMAQGSLTPPAALVGEEGCLVSPLPESSNSTLATPGAKSDAYFQGLALVKTLMSYCL
ncbi:unnamed protein product [Camellia sinensis]